MYLIVASQLVGYVDIYAYIYIYIHMYPLVNLRDYGKIIIFDRNTHYFNSHFQWLC